MSLVKKLKIHYDDFNVEIENWEVLDSGVTVLWGPSGSGKTSVFRGLIGLERNAQCEWIFKNQDLGRMSTPERKIGVVFQNYELFGHMTVYQNLKFAAQARKINAEVYESKITHLTKQLRIESLKHKNVKLLSGGERQRAALAQSLVGDPNILFLDEPFSALDEELRQESRELVKAIIEEYQIPVLLITHDNRDVDFLAKKVTLIKNGRIIDQP